MEQEGARRPRSRCRFSWEAVTNDLRIHELLTKPSDKLFTAHHRGEDGPGPTSLFIFII